MVGTVDGTTSPAAIQRKFKLHGWGSTESQPVGDDRNIRMITYNFPTEDAYLRALEHAGKNPPDVRRRLAEADVIALEADLKTRGRAIEAAQTKLLKVSTRLHYARIKLEGMA